MRGGIFKAGPCVLLAGAEGTASVCEEELEAHKAEGRSRDAGPLGLSPPRAPAAADVSDAGVLSCMMPTCLELFHRDHGLSAIAVSQTARVGAADQALQLVRKSVPALSYAMTSKLRVLSGPGVKQAR